MTTITLAKIGKNTTVNFAVDELCKYLKMMDKTVLIDRRVYDEYDASANGVIWVGLTPMVKYQKLDDEIMIDVKAGAGVITAANERAVLIAAYRFLRELGCRWIRPGDDGEIIPEKKLEKAEVNVSVREMPSNRYRGIVIEGASHYEHIYNMINWMPKVSLNAYYFQFYAGDAFLHLWYMHKYNPFIAPEEYTFEEALHTKTCIFDDLAKRGIIGVGPGHGFCLFPFGIYEIHAEPDDPRINDDFISCMAEIDGKRGLFKDKVNFTHLCYSNPAVRKRMIDGAIKYCLEHPTIELLRFGLADGMNNHCECEQCRKMRPSDWLMMLLNELDEALSANGLETKVGFSAYVDTLWPPEHIKVNNPDRFVFNLSPSSRTYSKPLYEVDVDPATVTLPPYERNKLNMPRDVETLVALYWQWKKWLGTKSTIFDYQMMWDHFLDPGYATCAKILHADATGLNKLDFIGYFSCQEQRAAFPTCLPVYALAAGLWDKNSKFEDISSDYYAAAFGEDGAAVEAYLQKISDLFDPVFMRNENPEAHRTAPARMDAIDALVDEFKASHIDVSKDKNASWKYLWYHADYCKHYTELIRAYITGDEALIEEKTKAFTHYHFSIEPETHTVLDNFQFDEVYQRWIKRVFANKPTNEVDF